MICIHCSSATQVINSRPQKRTNQVWRRRKCLKCGAVVSTIESVDFTTSLRVRNRAGKLVPLSRDKLFLSLHKSLAHRPTAIADTGALSTTIIAKITPLSGRDIIPSKTIDQAAIVALNRFDKVASTHYQAFHKS
jgi:transcriptional repressor NrdR